MAGAKVGSYSKIFHRLKRNGTSLMKQQGPAACVDQHDRRSHTSITGQGASASKYGGRYTVTMMPGDGVGPELMKHVKTVFRQVGAPVDFEEVKLDSSVVDEHDLDHALLSIKRNGVALKGNLDTNLDELGPAARSRNLELRAELDLFANVVWCRSLPGIHTRHSNIDIVFIRENTEGEYSSLEHMVTDEAVGGIVESLKIITEAKSMRIAKYAFDFAVKHGRKKVTAIHKANIMKLGDGLFLECCRRTAQLYPSIEFQDMIVDNTCMQMVSNPQQFDVMVLPNLYGNIITNIGAGLVGGPGVVPGVNLGRDYALFETGTRNTGRNIAGKNVANPSGMLLAGAELLNYLGMEDKANKISESVMKVINEDKIHTPDIGGGATTDEVVQAILNNIAKSS